MGRTAFTEPQCLYKGALYLYLLINQPIYITSYHKICGPVSSVGMATGYRMDGPGIESRWGARFSAPVQTSPRAQPASCTIGTGSFPWVKSGRGVTLTPHSLLVPWSWKSRAISDSWIWGCVLGSVQGGTNKCVRQGAKESGQICTS